MPLTAQQSNATPVRVLCVVLTWGRLVGAAVFANKMLDQYGGWVLVKVAARSKVWVCGRSPAGIVGSNPAEGVDVCLRTS